jgi:hypothetical protein
MITRCRNPKHVFFGRYGGAGITVCERWLTYENFLADMGPRPPGLTIDRIKNERGYEPGNCRWATRKEQQRNRKCCRYLELNGRRLLIQDWAQELGVNISTLSERLRKGWSVERTLTTPVDRSRSHAPIRKLTPDQVRQIRERHAANAATTDSLAEEFGVTKNSIDMILQRLSWRNVA